MRFVTYLACATVVAQASVVEEDDDLQFMRILSSNGTNATATTTTTQASGTTSNTTTAPASTKTNTTETTTTTEASTTKTNTTETTTTTQASGSTTGADNENVKKPPKADSDALTGLMANVTNGTNTSKAVVISVATKTKAMDPMYCGIKGLTTGTCAPAAGASNTTNSTLRMLASHAAADLVKAHDTFCGAFSFSGAYATCKGLGASVVKLFTPSVTTATPTAAETNAAMNFCVTGLTLASKVGTTNCLQLTTTMTDGACFGNGMEVLRATSAAATPPVMEPLTVPAIRACTTSSGTDPAAMDFATSTAMSVPEWRTTGANAVTVDAAAITTAAKTAAADTSVLQNALVMAAVEISISQPTAAASSNLATALGMSAADLKAISDVVVAGGGVGKIDLSEVATPSATSTLGKAITTASAKVAAAYVPVITVEGTGGGATSGATTMMVGASVIGFLSLVF
jgi:hypothetical protein